MLQRAYSVRVVNPREGIEEGEEEWLKKVMPHVNEDESHEDVTPSYPSHVQNLIIQSKRNLLDGISQTSACRRSPVDGTSIEQSQQRGEDGENDHTSACRSAGDSADEDSTSETDETDIEHLPPTLQRGIRSQSAMSSISTDSGPTSREWEPNVHLKLDEFEEDTVSFLAEGAMCQCFLALTTPDSMKIPQDLAAAAQKEGGVVIKTPGEDAPESAENDLVIESLVLRELRHPNILQLLGAGVTPSGSSFIVLEYLGRGTLRERLDSIGGGLGVKPSVSHGEKLASALAYMHDKAIPGMIVLHRDLKPDNIGFTSTGEPKLLDFGLAKVITRRLRCGSIRYQMTGETGSPRYMPPEVARNEPYNEKADVWSFIIILWEMMSGRLPFAGMSMQMYLEKVCKCGERPIISNNWPVEVKKLLAAGWQSDPDKRQSFREIQVILKGMANEHNASSGKKWFSRKT